MMYVCDAGLTTLGAVGVGFLAKKTMGDSLGLPSTPMGIAKLGVAVGTGTAWFSFLRVKTIFMMDLTALRKTKPIYLSQWER